MDHPLTNPRDALTRPFLASSIVHAFLIFLCKVRSFRLGETLDVCIHRIDPVSSKLDLALAPRF